MELTLFENQEFGKVRALSIDNEPWFVGKDVASVLGYKDTADAIKRHVDVDDKLTRSFTDSGQSREMYIINESGMYSLMLSSKLPNAKKFKKWVTSDVLPAIRKHGVYATEELLNNPDFSIKALTELKDEREKRAALETKVEQDKPKVLFANAVANSNELVLVRDLAKILKQNGIGIGQNRLYTWLRGHGYICKGSLEPTQKAMELGLFKVVVRTFEDGQSNPLVKRTTKVTQKGVQYFINKFLGEDNED